MTPGMLYCSMRMLFNIDHDQCLRSEGRVPTWWPNRPECGALSEALRASLKHLPQLPIVFREALVAGIYIDKLTIPGNLTEANPKSHELKKTAKNSGLVFCKRSWASAILVFTSDSLPGFSQQLPTRQTARNQQKFSKLYKTSHMMHMPSRADQAANNRGCLLFRGLRVTRL